MKLLQATNQDGNLILNDFATVNEISKRIYWRDSTPYYLSKDDDLLIPFKAIRVTNVYQEEDQSNGTKKND